MEAWVAIKRTRSRLQRPDQPPHTPHLPEVTNLITMPRALLGPLWRDLLVLPSAGLEAAVLADSSTTFYKCQCPTYERMRKEKLAIMSVETVDDLHADRGYETDSTIGEIGSDLPVEPDDVGTGSDLPGPSDTNPIHEANRAKYRAKRTKPICPDTWSWEETPARPEPAAPIVYSGGTDQLDCNHWRDTFFPHYGLDGFKVNVYKGRVLRLWIRDAPRTGVFCPWGVEQVTPLFQVIMAQTVFVGKVINCPW